MLIPARLLIGTALVAIAAPAFAAAPAAAPSPTPLGDTISLELGPEWGATSPSAYKDTYFKAGFSHSLGNGFSLGATIQETAKANNTGAWQPETTLGYKWKADAFTFGLSGGVGYTSDTVGSIGGNTNSAALVGAYYVASGTVDWKLDSKWTWNAINARYRNSFSTTWITPKVSTGFTYTIDPRQSTYFSVGYAWKEGTSGSLKADKINVAVGYKVGF